MSLYVCLTRGSKTKDQTENGETERDRWFRNSLGIVNNRYVTKLLLTKNKDIFFIKGSVLKKFLFLYPAVKQPVVVIFIKFMTEYF